MRRRWNWLVFLGWTAVAGPAAAQDAAPEQPPPAPPPKTSFRQVQMHVWISETTEKGLRDLGANLTYTRFVRGRETSGDALQQVNTNVFDPRNPLFNVTLPTPNQTLFDRPLRPDLSGNLGDGLQTQSGAGLTFSIIEDDHGTLDGVFRSIEQKADVDLISKPELLVIDGEQAVINAGGKVPYQDIKYDPRTGEPQLNVAFRNIGVNMRVTPTILPNGFVQLKLDELDVTDVARIENIRGIDLPVFATRSQTGMVIVPDGQTLVIGGLSSRVIRKTERRVPVLGRIPLLGVPFRGRQSDVTNVILVVFVAPTVVDLREMTPAAVNALDFWREGGWRNVQTIEEEIKTMQVE